MIPTINFVNSLAKAPNVQADASTNSKYDAQGRGGRFFDVVSRIGKVSPVRLHTTIQLPTPCGMLYRSCLPGGSCDIENTIRDVWLGLSPALVVCLVTEQEINLKTNCSTNELYRGLDSRFIAFDMNTEAAAVIRAALTSVNNALMGGATVIVHCSGGIGRTGMFCGLLMRTMGGPLLTRIDCMTRYT